MKMMWYDIVLDWAMKNVIGPLLAITFIVGITVMSLILISASLFYLYEFFKWMMKKLHN